MIDILRRRDRVSASSRPNRTSFVGASVESLEDRKLMTLLAVYAYAKPQILPPNGRYQPVEISGEVVNNRLDVKPTVVYRVIDQYRQDEPSGGPVALTMVKPGDYTFKFTIYLQAKRSSHFRDARQYSVTLGYQDPDNGAGKTVAVIVPNPSAATPKGPRVASHPSKLPPINPPARSSGFPKI